MSLLDVFFPRRCIGCNKEGGWLCLSCRQIVEAELSSPHCDERSQYRLIWLTKHGGLTRELLHTLKYHSLSCLASQIIDCAPTERVEELLLSPDRFFIPVPVSRERLKERGFNQAEQIALAWKGKISGQISHALVRLKQKGTQVGKTAEERQRQAGQSFQWVGGVDMRGSPVLVDDVFTTGSTAESCLACFPDWGIRPTVLVVAKA